MATAKKSVAKKSIAKKTSAAAKRAAASKSVGATTTRSQTGNVTTVASGDAPASTVTDRPPDSAPVQMTGSVSETPEGVAARETLHGRKKWGTGSDRDANLKKAGLDPRVVARERNRLRNEAKS